MGPTASTGTLQRILDTAAGLGVDPDHLASEAGLCRAALSDRNRRVPVARLYDLWHQAVCKSGDPSLPVRVASGVQIDQLGVFGFAVMTAPTLLVALETAARYYWFVTDRGKLTVDREGREVIVRWHRHGVSTPGRALSNESVLAHVAVCLQQVACEQVPILGLRLRHSIATKRRGLRELFDCRIVGEANEDALIVPRHRLDAVPRAANSAMHVYFCADAERGVAALASDQSDVAARVEAEIRRALPGGQVAMSRVARHLGMTARTLHRHLAARDLSFRAMVDKARMAEAATLLADTEMTVAQIALELGFADASAFSRAFRRARGVSPSTWRSRE